MPTTTRETAAWRRLLWPAFVAALAGWGLALAAAGRGSDFLIYLRTGARFLAGEPLYPLADGPWIFKYAPASAWLFVPFTALPPAVAVGLWNTLSVGALAFAAHRFSRLLEAEGEAPLPPAVRVAATLALAQSLFQGLFYGQVDLVLLALLVAAADAARRERSLLAGGLLAVAVHLKPPAALLALAFLHRRPLRALGWAALVSVALWVPVVLRYGVAGTRAELAAWAETLARTTPPWILGHNPQGLPSLLLGLALGTDAPAPGAGALALAQLTSAAIFLGLIAAARPSPALRIAFISAGVALLSPLAWRANFVLAWPLLALTLRTGRGGLLAGAAMALVQWGVNDGWLGAERFQAVMLGRPFGLACLGLLGFHAAHGLALRRRGAAPRVDAAG